MLVVFSPEVDKLEPVPVVVCAATGKLVLLKTTAPQKAQKIFDISLTTQKQHSPYCLCSGAIRLGNPLDIHIKNRLNVTNAPAVLAKLSLLCGEYGCRGYHGCVSEILRRPNMDKSFSRWIGACFAASMFLASAPSFAQEALDKGPGSSVKPAATAPTAEEKARQEEDDRKRKAAEVRNKAIEANNRGVEFQAKNNNADALKAFQEALQIDPSYERARENLAIAYYNLGSESINAKKWADAIDNYEAARTYDREMRERTSAPLAVAYNNQAAALVEAKRLDDAVAAMTQAANLDPKYQSELSKLKAYRDQVASTKKPTK